MSLSPDLIVENPNAASAGVGVLTTLIAAGVMGIEVLDPVQWVKPLAVGGVGFLVTRGAIHLDTPKTTVTVGKAAISVQRRGKLIRVVGDIAVDDADAMAALGMLGLAAPAPAPAVVPAPAPAPAPAPEQQAPPCPLPPHKKAAA